MASPQTLPVVITRRAGGADEESLGRLAASLWEWHKERMATNEAYRQTVLSGLTRAARRTPVLAPVAEFAVDVYGTL